MTVGVSNSIFWYGLMITIPLWLCVVTVYVTQTRVFTICVTLSRGFTVCVTVVCVYSLCDYVGCVYNLCDFVASEYSLGDSAMYAQCVWLSRMCLQIVV